MPGKILLLCVPQVSHQLGSLMDVFATLLDLAGIAGPTDRHMDGLSLTSVLLNHTQFDRYYILGSSSVFFFLFFLFQLYVGSMYDDIRLHVTRSYTSPADSPFFFYIIPNSVQPSSLRSSSLPSPLYFHYHCHTTSTSFPGLSLPFPPLLLCPLFFHFLPCPAL